MNILFYLSVYEKLYDCKRLIGTRSRKTAAVGFGCVDACVCVCVREGAELARRTGYNNLNKFLGIPIRSVKVCGVCVCVRIRLCVSFFLVSLCEFVCMYIIKIVFSHVTGIYTGWF